MSVIVRSSWDLVLRVTIVYLVFYTTLYFLISFINGVSLAELAFRLPTDMPGDPVAVMWLKFCGDIAARLIAAVLLSYMGVPRYRFALLHDGALFTGFRAIFPRWFSATLLLSIVTTMGTMLPMVNNSLPLWLGFHLLFTYGTVHTLMHGEDASKRLRLVEGR